MDVFIGVIGIVCYDVIVIVMLCNYLIQFVVFDGCDVGNYRCWNFVYVDVVQVVVVIFESEVCILGGNLVCCL